MSTKLLDRILEISTNYFSKFPSIESVKVFGSRLVMGWTFTDPFTNSKKKVDVLWELEGGPKGKGQGHTTNTLIMNSLPTLTYEEKPNRVEISNGFGSYLVNQKHQGLVQDEVFGMARRTKDNLKWVYLAKLKDEKTKSYFDGGRGLNPPTYDFGQRYTNTNHLGIFLLDTPTRTITKLPIPSTLFPSTPDFLSPTHIVFTGYKRQHFGFGVSHCFNRESGIYEAKLVGEKYEISVIPSKYRSSLAPKASPCGRYVMYFAGTGETHVFYMDVVVVRRSQSQEGKWEEWFEVKEFFVGSHAETRSEFYQHQGKLYALVQTVIEGRVTIWRVDVEGKKIEQYSENRQGESVSILAFDPNTNLLVAKLNTANELTCCYAYLPNKLQKIPPFSTQPDIQTQFLQKPIPHFILRSNTTSSPPSTSTTSTKSPLVVAIHGGPHGYSQPTLTFFKYLLLKLGYTIVYPNFTGSAGWGKKFLEGALGKIGEVDAREIVECVQQLIKSDQRIDAKRVYLYGGSYGGYMSGILGGRFPQYFTSAILLNPVLSLPFMLGTTDIPEWCTVQSLNSGSLHNLTSSDYQQLYKHSPISTPLKIPGLLILGQKDRRVPYEAGKLYAALVKGEGVGCEVYIYPESDHRLADSVETGVDVVVKSVVWMEEGRVASGEGKEEVKEESKEVKGDIKEEVKKQ